MRLLRRLMRAPRLNPPSARVLLIRAALIRIADQRWPYVYGGGHERSDGKPGPSRGTDPNNPLIGLDCSGAISWVLYLVGWLGVPYPLSTAGLIVWGEPGQGAYVTVWVRNDRYVQHSVIQIKHLDTPTEWWEAGHTGMIVGWIKEFDPTNYTPRRLP